MGVFLKGIFFASIEFVFVSKTASESYTSEGLYGQVVLVAYARRTEKGDVKLSTKK